MEWFHIRSHPTMATIAKHLILFFLLCVLDYAATSLIRSFLNNNPPTVWYCISSTAIVYIAAIYMVKKIKKQEMKAFILGILICSITYLLLDVLLHATAPNFPTGFKAFISGVIGISITSFFVRKLNKKK